MDITCSAEPCPIILNATCVFYEGNTLIYTGITTNDNLQTALQKIDQKFQDAGLGYIFSNGIEQLTPGGAVMLGGALIQNTTIGGLYNLAFAGTLEASALITTGGTSTDFVKGDGSLDSTSYQPSGNYISNLTGDVTANGPGSVTATLATVFGSPGTYGNSGSVPSITVDGKGRVINVTPIPINYPAQSLSFVGDVDGFGFTGSPVTLTLDTVNTDVYGSNNFLKFAVNGKGLITSATPVSGGDITTALGYVPVDDSIQLSINGVAQDLTANRSWSVGTVTSVGVTAGLGISASVSNPNTTPVINIVNTAPDQTVNLNAGFGISVTGSYPNFTITNDYPDLPNEGVTSFSAGNLSPLFTTSVINPTTTPALNFALSSAAANTVFAGPDGGAGAPTFRSLVAADLPSLSYISSISTTAPLATTGGLTPTLSISQAGSATDGYLSSADWTTFNSKQPAGNYITDLTGDATASGPGSACLTLATVNATLGTFGSSTQVPVITVNGKGLVTCVTTSNISGSLEFIGDVTGIGSTGTCTSLTLATVNNDVYTSETLLNIAVNGKGLITSANPTTAGDICSTLGYTPEDVANKSTCTSLGVSNTLYPTQLAVKTYIDNATAGGIILQGNWNAATNTPDITGTTTTGWAWRVDVAGTTNLGGITDWQVGDLAVKSATGWVKIDNTENVTSVFGRFGAIVATTGDYLSCQVTECGNLYYTDARVRAAVGHTAPLTYNSTTGVFGITQSNATTDGYLSATDWTTFNDKQPALGYTPVNQTRQLTINGTTYDLSADRTWNVGTVTSVTGSAPLSSSGGTTPNLTITQAGVASNGFLSSTDWNTFNSKTSCLGTVTCVAASTSTTGVSITGSPITSSGTLGINVSTASTVCTGLLTAADWNTFNSHTGCTGTVTSVGLTSSTTGVSIGGSPITSSGNLSLNIATASATCTGLLTAADWNTFNSHTGCTGTVTSVNATGTNISVTGGPITTSGSLAISLSGANVCSALGYTPYNATNPNGYTTCIGTVTSAGIVATNINVCNSPVTTSGNICLNLTGANVCSALGYSPVQPNGTGATGTWPISITGSSGTSNVTTFVCSPDGGRNPDTAPLPNTNPRSVSYNFATSGSVGGTGNYAGVMTYSPWDGTSASTGDSSYQLAFLNDTGVNASGIPGLSIRNGINSSWNATWYRLLTSGNYNSYSPTLTGGGASGTWSITATGNVASRAQSNWNDSTVINNVIGLMAWKNYGNAHVIFDASQGTSPSGGGVSQTNATNAWTATFPTLMGWNGSQTYGVRVDSARVADSAGSATTATYATNSTRLYATDNPYCYGCAAPYYMYMTYDGTRWLLQVSPATPSAVRVSYADSAGSVDFNNLTNKTGGTGTYQTSGDFRAPIFYDSNDTTYYADFNSTTSAIFRGSVGLNNTSPINSAWGNATTTTQLSITGSNYGLINLRGDLNGARTFSMGVGDNTFYMCYDNTAGRHNIIVNSNGNVTAAVDFRAPIFYDSNDTTYYLDPNSTGTSLNIAGSVNAATFNKAGLLVNSSGTGSAGSAMAIQQVTGEGWTGIFVDYEPYTGWGLYHDNPANYFLITSESANGSFGAGFSVPSRSSGNRTAYVKHRFDQNNGEIIAGGMIYSYASVRAPIFYDSDDTSYYVDPNGTSNLLKLSGRTMAYNDMNPMSANSPYAARYNGSAQYRNGTMGYGTVDFNVILSNWGSGFIDTWGSPGNAPGGSTHYVGLQSFHYNFENSSQAYGFQMACAGEADNRFFWRSAWPNVRSWVEMIHSGNIGSQSVSYANSAGSASVASRAYYSIDGFTNTGGHGTSYIQNELPAANNGAATGRVVLYQWCSEPGVTWDWAGFGYNVINNGGSPNGFGRFNGNFGQAYMRFASNGDWYFYNTTTGGVRTTSMSFSSTGAASFGNTVAVGSSINIGTTLYVNSTATIAYSGLSGDFGGGYTTGLGVGYSSSVAKGINMGWNTTLDRGFIGPVHNGIAWKSLILCPIAGDVYIGAAGTNNIYAGAFFEGSDMRLKQLIEDDYKAVGIESVKARLYTKGGRLEIGYYAQDLEFILPSAVSKNDGEFLSLSYTQVHTAKIAIIEDEVDILKKEVKELKSKLQKYEA